MHSIINMYLILDINIIQSFLSTVYLFSLFNNQLFI